MRKRARKSHVSDCLGAVKSTSGALVSRICRYSARHDALADGQRYLSRMGGVVLIRADFKPQRDVMAQWDEHTRICFAYGNTAIKFKNFRQVT